MTISPLFDPAEWADAEPGYDDITVHRSRDGRIARIAFDRPEVRNAFRPHTVDELYRALDAARQDSRIGVVLLTGNGPSAKDGGWAFCSGGDQRIRGRDGYKYAEGSQSKLKAGRTAVWVTERAIQILGGYGYTREYPVERWHRDAKIMDIFEGTEQIKQLVISRAISGMRIE